MPDPHFRRIGRRAVLALAGVVLLVSGYVASYVSLHWLDAREVCDIEAVSTLQQSVFWPIREYTESQLPASDVIEDMRYWAHWQGVGLPMTWKELRDARRETER